jgi:sarcosine oxidase subunit beta
VSAASYEIVVVGGGIEGSSVAYHLARQGRQVLVVERAEPAVEPAASWASAAGVRRQGRHPAEAKLASEAISRWPSLEAELEADMGYRGGGNLYLAEGDNAAQRIAEFVRQQQENGFTDVRFVDRKDALEIVPGLGETVQAGSFSPQDGQAEPVRSTRAFAAAAQRQGAAYWNGAEVLELVRQGDRVTGLRTSRGEVSSETVVLAAGAWSDELAATVDLQLPIRTRVPQILISTPAPPGTLVPVIGAADRRLSLKQRPGGEFMLGGGWPGRIAPDRRSYEMLDSSIEGGWAAGVAILPAVGRQMIARRYCGLEAQSFDEIPLIGPAPGLEGLTIVTGFSGHGFAIAPAVGRAVADQLAGKPTPELDGLDPIRTLVFDPAAVERFLNEPAESDISVG